MAKYTVTYSCGHIDEVQLLGKYEDRKRKLAWYAEQAVCPDCYQAKIDAGRQAKLEEAREANTGLVALVGSEKQVNWAEQIRAEWMARVEASLKAFAVTDATKAEAARKMMLEAVNSIPSAKWWIDSRHDIKGAIAPRCAEIDKRNAAGK